MKTLAVLLFKMLPALKFGKIFTTAGTMLLSLAVYATQFGWPFAAGFIALLFAHEMGHYIAMRQRGLDAGAPVFIPFLGAFIQMKDQPHDAETEAYVAIAGPLVGTVAAFAAYFYAQQTHSHLWLAVSYSGFFLNLFNLIPVSPLDGGRITAVLSPRVWLAGVPILVAAFVYVPSPVLIIIALLAFPQLVAAWKYDPERAENRRYYGVSPSVKIEYAGIYFVLAAALAVMTYNVHLELSGRGA
jgi:Zn-dependent protease